MTLKPGIKSTELIVSIIMVAGGIFVAAFEGEPWAQALGTILSAIGGTSYIAGRSIVKSNAAKADALVALKKKE